MKCKVFIGRTKQLLTLFWGHFMHEFHGSEKCKGGKVRCARCKVPGAPCEVQGARCTVRGASILMAHHMFCLFPLIGRPCCYPPLVGICVFGPKEVDSKNFPRQNIPFGVHLHITWTGCQTCQSAAQAWLKPDFWKFGNL